MHLVEERRCHVEPFRFPDEEVDDTVPVDRLRHSLEPDDRPGVGSEREEMLARVIGEWFCAEVIARQEELLATLVPDGECEVTQQVIDAVLTPGSIRMEEQTSVADLARVAPRQTEFRNQLRAIVEPYVGDNHIPGGWLDERHLLMERLGCGMEGSVTQSDHVSGPCPRSLGSAAGHDCQHLVEFARPARQPFSAEDTRNRTHSLILPLRVAVSANPMSRSGTNAMMPTRRLHR